MLQKCILNPDFNFVLWSDNYTPQHKPLFLVTPIWGGRPLLGDQYYQNKMSFIDLLNMLKSSHQNIPDQLSETVDKSVKSLTQILHSTFLISVELSFLLN